MELFVVRDRKAGVARGQVFSDHNVVESSRAFEKACRVPDSIFASHPDDFELLHLGTFDERSLKFKMLESPAVIGSPRDYLGIKS